MYSPRGNLWECRSSLRYVRIHKLPIIFLKQVSREREGKIVDGRCHSLTASYVRERHNYDEATPICNFYEGFDMEGKEQLVPSGIYSIDDLKEYGRDRNWCPYFLARFTVSIRKHAGIFLS